MSSREIILKAITANKPTPVELPRIEIDSVVQYEDVVAQFRQALESIGAKVIETTGIQLLQQQLETEKAGGHFVINTIPALGEPTGNLSAASAQELAGLYKAYIQGTLGVAENGAVWLYEHQLPNRLLPFICEYLVLVIDRDTIVPTMHHALEKIDLGTGGFGVFIAGPSKTADIEQSLVIGAHGARGLTVYLV